MWRTNVTAGLSRVPQSPYCCTLCSLLVLPCLPQIKSPPPPVQQLLCLPLQLVSGESNQTALPGAGQLSVLCEASALCFLLGHPSLVPFIYHLPQSGLAMLYECFLLPIPIPRGSQLEQRWLPGQSS